MTAAVYAVAKWEFRNSVRARWVLVMGAIFALLGATVTLLAFRSVRTLGLTGVGPASATLINLGVLLPSLIGLLQGSASLVGAREQGMLSLICVQPVRRSSIGVGVFLGLTGSLWATLGVGYGLVLVIMSGAARSSDVPALVTLAGVTLAVAAASVAIGVAVSALSATRVQALAAAVGIWVVLALGVDLALASIASSARIGPEGLLAAILLNPLEAARVLGLLGTSFEGTALGPLGAYLISRFGTVGTVSLLIGDLLVWTAAPLAFARWALLRRDL